MVMPTGDGAMAAVAQNYDALSELAHIGAPPPAIMERVLDKSLTLEAAKECGIPIPASHTVDDPSEVPNLIRNFQFPVIAKPVIRKGANTYRIKYFATAEQLLAELSSDEEAWRGALLQEYIPGVGKGIGVLMHDNDPVAMFQHRRIKELPYTGGVSVMAEAEAVDPKLGELAVSLLRQIEWQGVALVEYRYDPSDGRFALMEINGRYWGSLFLPYLAGVDFPYYEWQLAHGERPQVPDTYKVGLQARWLVGDIARLHGILDGSHRSEIDPPAPWKETFRFIWNFNPRTRGAIWSMADPMPAIAELRASLTSLFKSDARRLLSVVLPPPLIRQLRIYRRLAPKLRRIFLKQQIRRLFGLQRSRPRSTKAVPTRILFVCHGNVIRSPTAEHLLQRKLNGTALGTVEIQSAGLWEGLNRVEPRPSPDDVQTVAAELGLCLTDHRSQPTTKQLIADSELIFVMDHQNEAMLLAQYPAARQKLFLLGAFKDKPGISNLEIADPWGREIDDIRECLSNVEVAVDRLADALKRAG